MPGRESLLRIVSLDGKVVYHKELTNKLTEFREEISLENFSRGVYLIRLITPNNVQTRRLIIE
jgi:hypothetical protein